MGKNESQSGRKIYRGNFRGSPESLMLMDCRKVECTEVNEHIVKLEEVVRRSSKDLNILGH